MQIHYHRGQTAAKIRNLATLNSAAHIKQRRCAAYMAGENNRALYIASSESCKPNRNSFGIGTNLKESILRATTKSIPLLQPERGARVLY